MHTTSHQDTCARHERSKERCSGIAKPVARLDVSDILGTGAYLTSDQAHYLISRTCSPAVAFGA